MAIQEALHRAGYTQPTLIVDRDRLDRNLERTRQSLADGMGLRIVAKSLPSQPLLERAMTATGAHRLMTFNLPMLMQLAEALPGADQLLGKPFPVAAAASFLDGGKAGGAAARVQWLVDTRERLAQYEDLARAREVELLVVLELDVGLHRGGFPMGRDLDAALRLLKDSKHLTFSGLMGYEPHVASIPTLAGWRGRVRRRALDAYAAANHAVAEILGQAAFDSIVRNTAGSLTFRSYADTSIANDVSMGSALVKPSHFDHPDLADFEPALFIAAPVLKVLETVTLPGLEALSGIRRHLGFNARKGMFIHGGAWKADPVDPSGSRYNRTFGRSSNQEMIEVPRNAPLRPDDFIFLRPTQSEAVMQQFGDIAVFADGEIVDSWAALPVSP